MSSGVTGMPERARRKEWIGLAVLALPTLLIALDVSVVYLALPRISVALGASPTQQLWIADTYGFMLAGFLIPMGSLGDRIGRRKLLLIGAATFAAASLLAAFSQDAAMLIVARALLGIAGASLNPSTLALITNMFADPKQRQRAFAIWVAYFMGGTALGPVIGGLLLHFFWWGSVFLLGAPVMVVLLICGPLFLPEFRSPTARRIDLPSVALALAGILPVVYGIKEFAANGFTAVAAVAIVFGLAFGYAFVRRQRSLDDPLLDLSLFARGTVRVSVISLLLNSVAMSGVALLVNQYLESVMNLSPLVTGVWLILPSAAVIVSVLAAPRLAHRFRPAYVIAGGSAITTIGCLLLTQAAPTGSLALVEIGYLLGMFGVGPIVGLATDLIVGQAPPDKAGSVGAVKETADNLGFALGAALLGSIATAVFRDTLVVPGGASSVAGQASNTLGEAVAATARLPAAAGQELLSAARGAFTSGFTIAALTAAVIGAAIVVLVVVTLRHLPASGSAQATQWKQAQTEAELVDEVN